MDINTKYLGVMDIDAKNIIHFPKGLPGFDNHKEFVIINFNENKHINFLQDINHKDLCFLIISPWDFFNDYEINIPDDNLKTLGIKKDEKDKIAIYNIVTIGKTLEESTCNLIAPIVVNIENMKGKQFILNDAPYETKHKLFKKGDKNASAK